MQMLRPRLLFSELSEMYVHEAGTDGILRHPVKLGRIRILHDNHAVLLFDIADSVRAVGTGPRQNHGDCPVLVSHGQGPEENIDRMIDYIVVIAAQMQHIRGYLQIIARRDQVDVIPADLDSVRDLKDGKRRVLPQYLGKKALMVRGQMLDNDKRHPGVPRQKCQKLLQRFQASCGSTDPDNTVGLNFNRYLHMIIFHNNLS